MAGCSAVPTLMKTCLLRSVKTLHKANTCLVFPNVEEPPAVLKSFKFVSSVEASMLAAPLPPMYNNPPRANRTRSYSRAMPVNQRISQSQQQQQEQRHSQTLYSFNQSQISNELFNPGRGSSHNENTIQGPSQSSSWDYSPPMSQTQTFSSTHMHGQHQSASPEFSANPLHTLSSAAALVELELLAQLSEPTSSHQGPSFSYAMNQQPNSGPQSTPMRPRHFVRGSGGSDALQTLMIEQHIASSSKSLSFASNQLQVAGNHVVAALNSTTGTGWSTIAPSDVQFSNMNSMTAAHNTVPRPIAIQSSLSGLYSSRTTSPVSDEMDAILRSGRSNASDNVFAIANVTPNHTHSFNHTEQVSTSPLSSGYLLTSAFSPPTQITLSSQLVVSPQSTPASYGNTNYADIQVSLPLSNANVSVSPMVLAPVSSQGFSSSSATSTSAGSLAMPTFINTRVDSTPNLSSLFAPNNEFVDSPISFQPLVPDFTTTTSSNTARFSPVAAAEQSFSTGHNSSAGTTPFNEYDESDQGTLDSEWEQYADDSDSSLSVDDATYASEAVAALHGTGSDGLFEYTKPSTSSATTSSSSFSSSVPNTSTYSLPFTQPSSAQSSTSVQSISRRGRSSASRPDGRRSSSYPNRPEPEEYLVNVIKIPGCTKAGALAAIAQRTPDGEYICPYCPESHAGRRVFKTPTNLRAHCKLHHERGRTKACPDCGKRFLRKQDLDRHLATHLPDGFKAFHCVACGLGFTRSDALKRHARSRKCIQASANLDALGFGNPFGGSGSGQDGDQGQLF